MKSLASIWKSELRKRESHAKRCARCDRNWLTHKAIGLAQFHDFASIAMEDWVFFHVVDFCESQNENENGPWTTGDDNIVLSGSHRFTGKETHYESLSGHYRDVSAETGGSLVVHYTYRQGLVQVFLVPPRTDSTNIKKAEILLWSSYNTDNLTSDFYRSLIAKFLVFCRVESSLDSSSIVDRCRVRWWKYMDIRNRRNLFPETHKYLNGWEISAAAALIAIASLVVSIFSAL